MPVTRLLDHDDAAVLADLLSVNRSFLAPWDPVRPESYYTVPGQQQVIRAALAQYEHGAAMVPHVILDDGLVVGRITLNNVVRGAFQSGTLGYWVSADANGRGLAAAAVAAMVQVAFEEQGLHRVEAGTLLHNVRSQRVLERNGFERYGVAPAYLLISGAWQDHALYQKVHPHWQPAVE